MNNFQCLYCGSPSLVLREPVQPLQDCPNVILSFLYECDWGVLSEGNLSVRRNSLNRPCLSSLVAKASVESSSTIILNTVSCISGVRGICVYIPTRLREDSMDSSKSTSASSLELTPLAAWFTWMSQRYAHRYWRTVHTENRTARLARIAFPGGYGFNNQSGMWKNAINSPDVPL